MPSEVTAAPQPARAGQAELWDRVVTLHAHVEHRLADALQRGHGLGLSEYRALGHLVPFAKGLRMQELADRIGLNQSSVTRLVARLNAAGFTYRDLCPDDRRGVYTVITEDGRARHAQARDTYRETLAAALDEASAADPELGAALAALADPGPPAP
ncbi:MarR family winged helix-turn-helix transcriptional regulator [Allostreptomyces psammosilenae]|uniref:DNA-binding MarR family transcriptional regulator n=1 Tax=Allostreptomyces psammosilenae TaxID=1892865 RepID=A0A852ZVB5_9ACTN|nr:MarR family transcriptional regulator [Allostreptomyces psammosilenae]NYI04724.1 DNA-binding MarR family transcriptional regulator [Allostreptomyces psammosilenae]